MKIQVTPLRLNSNSNFANLTQPRLNSNPNLRTWLNSDSTHLSQSWVKSDSRLITFSLIWEKVVDTGGGGGVRSNVAVGWFVLCKFTDNCKILTFSLLKISDSTFTHAVSSWLNSDSNDDQRDWAWMTIRIIIIIIIVSKLWVWNPFLTHSEIIKWAKISPGKSTSPLKKKLGREAVPHSPKTRNLASFCCQVRLDCFNSGALP